MDFITPPNIRDIINAAKRVTTTAKKEAEENKHIERINEKIISAAYEEGRHSVIYTVSTGTPPPFTEGGKSTRILKHYLDAGYDIEFITGYSCGFCDEKDCGTHYGYKVWWPEK